MVRKIAKKSFSGGKRIMDIINDISNFIFVDDEPEISEIIFIPGGSFPEPSERAADLWKNGFASIILPSGKYNTKIGHFPGVQTKKELYDHDFETEWDFMKYVLIKSGVDEKAILVENNAGEKGTYDNAFMSRAVTDTLGLTINKAIICCKSFHARRCQMTYSWAYPKTQFIICPVDNRIISRDNWFKSENGIKQVMSELQKCGQYFKESIPVYANRK
jgi:uncharacterized SAM-binding protein YcdF (DUF218 family)